LGAAAVLVGILALTEVPATVLISPLSPRPLVPLLMTWVHMLRYDDMLEGTLLLMGMAGGLALAAVGLLVLGRRWWVRRESRSQNPASRTTAGAPSSFFWILTSGFWILAAAGCSDPAKPEAVWLSTGAGPGQVVYPRAITYSPKDDTFFVIDRLARVQHLDREGSYLGEWRMPEHVTGKPVGLSVGPDGNVYVPDTHYQRVIVYSPKGELLRQWGSVGQGPGQFIYPTDIAFDSKGNVFVAEYGDNDRIQVFTPQGQFLYAFGQFGQGDGQFSRPQSVVIDADDTVYVTDACNHRIVVFRADGTFVRNMGMPGSEPGQFRYPYGLELGGDGKSLIVCEFGNNRIQKIDKSTGKGLGTWGSAGHALGELAYPWGVAVDKRGRVVAVDAGNNRLQVFSF
jgi:DNA-binding beta-propeller fold protein YncE